MKFSLQLEQFGHVISGNFPQKGAEAAMTQIVSLNILTPGLLPFAFCERM